MQIFNKNLFILTHAKEKNGNEKTKTAKAGEARREARAEKARRAATRRDAL